MILKLVAAFSLVFSVNALAGQIDMTKSSFKWRADKKIGDGHWGDIKLKSSKFKLSGEKIESAEFVMDLTSFTVDNLEGEWKDKFLTHIKSGDFFDVAKYPTATLIIEKQIGKDQVQGKLTIKDKTNPVTLKFNKSNNEYTGKFTFDRTQYGIIYGSGNFFKELAADKIIKNEVTLDFKVVLTKK